MFSELPKLFDRNFATAYFLPVTLFLAASGLLLKRVGYWSIISSIFTGVTLLDTTLVVFVAWMMGILLMVLNREIYRLLEGYGRFNPLRVFEEYAKSKYRTKRNRLRWLNAEYKKPTFTDALRSERDKLMEELAQKYPDTEKYVLPTAFGNTLRAFEIYPRVMYGIEGIDGWSRILAVLPKEYRELIDDAKSQVDWWVNLGVLSFLYLNEFWICIFSKWKLSLPWKYNVLNIFIPLVLFVLLNYVFSWRAVSSAIGWGDYVKTSFDLFRFDLLQSLGIRLPKTRKEEKVLWQKYSQAIVYRSPNSLPDLEITNNLKPKSSSASRSTHKRNSSKLSRKTK